LAGRNKTEAEKHAFIQKWCVSSQLEQLRSKMEDTGADPCEKSIRSLFKIDVESIDQLERLTAATDWGRRFWFMVCRGRITASACHKVGFKFFFTPTNF
jgi:hypothetical protein